MQNIKLGSKGDDVERWQSFLVGFYPALRGSLVIDGDFGPVTQAATIKFQQQFRLVADGIVGNTTVGTAMARGGFPIVNSHPDDQDGPSFPIPPADFFVLSDANREQMFGKLNYTAAPTPTNPEGIQILDGWEADNIITVGVPQFSKVPSAPKSGSARVNKHVATQFVNLWAAWDKAGLIDRILAWNGSFVPRFIRGSTTHISNHSYGSAFDINAQWNVLGAQPALKGEKGSVRELVMIAYSFGFSWGGWYKNRPDGMHFECYKII